MQAEAAWLRHSLVKAWFCSVVLVLSVLCCYSRIKILQPIAMGILLD